MATITTRFSLGDQVWSIGPNAEEIKLPCRCCRGRAWLEAKGADGESHSVPCPECGQSATVRLGSWPEWRVERSLRIGLIRVQVADHTGTDNGERGDNMNPARAERVGGRDEERYMCWETGVGSGSLHRVEDLFATPELAEEEAQARTERARRGEVVGDRGQWWPDAEQVRVAAGFLDHRDAYEHDAGHVALARAILDVAQARAGQEG